MCVCVCVCLSYVDKIWGFNVTGPGAYVTAAPRQCMNSEYIYKKFLQILQKLIPKKALIFRISKNNVRYINIQNHNL
jgi:hypothetical protein